MSKGGIVISTGKRTKKILLIVGICVAAVAVLIFLAAIVYGSVLKNSDTIFPNVTISEIPVGGMTREQADQALQEGLSVSEEDYTLTVNLPDRELVFVPEISDEKLDTALVLDAAMAYGREEGPIAALKTYYDSDAAYELDLETHIPIDEEAFRQLIDETAEEVKQEKIQSEVTMDEENELLTIKLGHKGTLLNADALYDKVIEAYTIGDFSDITFDYDVDPYDIVDLQPYYDKYCTPARNAYYNSAEQKLMPEIVGYGFDLVAVNAQMALAEDGEVLEVKLAVMEPTVTMEQYNNKNYPDVLASYRSAHTYNADRTANLTLACQAIDGTVLKPGEVFSFNAIVGERTADRGYKDGIIYADGGESELEAGGGICQVVSSVYMCALTADLQIVERQPHMYPVSYVKTGCDATVYWGAVDFKFKNTNSTPIKINASVSGGYVNVSFVGTNEHDYTVSMSSQLIETIPFEEVEKLDPTKPAGYRELTQAPHTGYIYWSYKNFYDLNGNFLRTEKCAISEYTKYDAEYIVGPEGDEEDEKDKEDEEEERPEEEPEQQRPQPPQWEDADEPEQEQEGPYGRGGVTVNTGGNKKHYRN